MKKLAVLAALAVAAPATAAQAASSDDATRAIATASRGLSVKAHELEREYDRWEIKFANGVERHVSLDGRRVIRTRRDRDDDDSYRVQRARISMSDAIRRAARRASGTVTDAELEFERGRLVWEVSFESGARETDVEVSAINGSIVRVKRERDYDR